MMEAFTIQDRKERTNEFLLREYGAMMPASINDGEVLLLDRLCHDMTLPGIDQTLADEFEVLLLTALHGIERRDNREGNLQAQINELEARLGDSYNYSQAGD